MLKSNNKNYEDIIKKLRYKKIESGDTLLEFNSFVNSTLKNVSIRIHQSEHVSEYHTHDFFEVNYVHEGNCINLVEEEAILMNRGDMIIIHPGVFHTLYADGECKVYNFLIKKDWLCEKIKSVGTSDGVTFQFLASSDDEDHYKYIIFPYSKFENEQVIAVAESLLKYELSDSPWGYLLLESATLEYFSLLGETDEHARLSKGKGYSSYKMINILMYVAENYKSVTLDELSKRFFYSKTHICRLFLKNTGKSFNQTLTDMKINRACSYLKNTESTVEEVARMVGYGSVEHFQRLFKKMIGMTPGEFKKSSKSK